MIEQTRNGIWGWVDDELAQLSAWGFDTRDVAAPTALWYDPDEKVLPAQHSRWLADAVPNATLVTTDALGHGSVGDPKPDWNRLYKGLRRCMTRTFHRAIALLLRPADVYPTRRA